jgi:outer membrane lipoprotein-sorting protein
VAVRKAIARKLRSSVLLAAALAAAGCAIAPPPPRAAIAPPGQRAVALLTERARQFSDLRTLADVSVQRATERYRVRGVILAKTPASVRFEALSPMGSPLLVATIQEGRITAYDATTDEVTTGPATAETAARLLNLPFEPEDLVGILAGRPVPPRDLREAEVLPPDADGPSVNLVGVINTQRVWMDLETGVVRQLQISGGRADARIVFRREADGTMTGFELTAGMGLVRSNVRYEQPAFNAGIEPDRFVFTPPKGAKTRTIR